jgi:hypothetical protein
MSPINSKESVDAFLWELWRKLRNNASEEKIQYVRGAIEMAWHLKAFSAEIRELWGRRIKTCPGHEDDLGSRDWCAFCGQMEKVEE